MEDRQLVHEFLTNRSESAFRNLYRSRTPHLYRIALRLTQDANESEELIQEMWMVAIRKLEDFEWRSELKTWLTGILINLSRAKRKKQEREQSIDSVQESTGESAEITFANTHDLEKAIAELPPGYRQAIILHDIEGYKHKEIADLLDITEGTSKSQLYHSRKALREYLSDTKQERS